jgi:DNA-binding XRE family transcriptional regulator
MRRAEIDAKKLRRLLGTMNQVELAKEFGVTKDTIRNRLRELGLYRPKVKLKEGGPAYKNKEALTVAYKETPSMLLLAERFRVSFSTIRHWMIFHGIERNTKKVCSRADLTKPWTNRKKLVAGYAKMGSKALARKWGCDQHTILNWLNRFVIDKREPTGNGVVHAAPYEQLRKLKNGRRRKLPSRECKALREKAGRCERCGYSEFIEVLEVHHLDHDTLNNKPNNQAVLCRNCHALDTLGLARIKSRRALKRRAW